MKSISTYHCVPSILVFTNKPSKIIIFLREYIETKNRKYNNTIVSWNFSGRKQLIVLIVYATYLLIIIKYLKTYIIPIFYLVLVTHLVSISIYSNKPVKIQSNMKIKQKDQPQMNYIHIIHYMNIIKTSTKFYFLLFLISMRTLITTHQSTY